MGCCTGETNEACAGGFRRLCGTVPEAEHFCAMRLSLPLAVLALAACSQSPDQTAPNIVVENIVVQADEAPAGDPYSRADNVALPDDRTPLEEPNGPIDPKSAEAAGQVVQSFGALIEQKRWSEAEALWSDAATATRFTAGLKRNGESHLEIGKPGAPEGAAGSVYVTVPIILYGRNASGSDFRRSANAVVRRVNDVPGATEAQRRWHIARIDLKA